MKRDVNTRVDTVEVVEHEHLTVIFGHGEIAVFGHHEVDADDMGMARIELGLNGLKAEKGLREDLLRREATKNLVEKANLNRTGARGCRRTALLDAVPGIESIGELFAIGGHHIAEAAGEKLIAEFREIGMGGSGGVAGAVERGIGRRGRPWDGVAELRRGEEIGGVHDLEILLILCRGSASDFVEPFTDVTVVDSRETSEGGEELIVTANACAGNKAAHGKVVDEGIVERLIFAARPRRGDSLLRTRVEAEDCAWWRRA